jgi:ubiquinone/menaquinone biosynthesis C-methylase UbiE
MDRHESRVRGFDTARRLLDLGAPDGETLRHISELHPDLSLCAVDIAGLQASYPLGCDFHQAHLQVARLPWPDEHLDAVTCMHLVEHLRDCRHVIAEEARLL